jgi:hypothetical protein
MGAATRRAAVARNSFEAPGSRRSKKRQELFLIAPLLLQAWAIPGVVPVDRETTMKQITPLR